MEENRRAGSCIAPLFVGLVVVLGLCVLGLAFTIGVHDVRQAKRNAQPVVTEPQPSFPKAA